ncbi:MAG: hemolysin XhlA family protein [bacterium]
MSGHEQAPAWALELRERMVRVETKLDYIGKANDTANEAKATADSCAKSICEIKSSLTWSWRAIAGALITGAIAAWMQLKGGN